MYKYKVLWFCNVPFSDTKLKGTGGWLFTMAEALIKTQRVELYNISTYKGKFPVRSDTKDIKQWLIPNENHNSGKLPSDMTIKYIQKVVAEVSPDFIHVWGTENFWGLLFSRGYLKEPFLLDMQGVIMSIINANYGGLSFTELLKCIWIKEIIFPRTSLFLVKRKYKKLAKIEKEVIEYSDFISTQSEWVRAHVKSINSNCKIYNTGIILRDSFYKAKQWEINKTQNINSPILFTSSSGATAYKGIHVLLKALFILKKTYPNILLKICGSQISKGIRLPGYTRWLLNEIKKNKLESNVDWLGALDDNSIIDHLNSSSVSIIPSFVESYSLALAESLILGVPTVVSYAGAMPEFANNEESALFYPIGDYVMCAYQINRLLINDILSQKLSNNARQDAIKRNDPNIIGSNQICIYDDFFVNNCK